MKKRVNLRDSEKKQHKKRDIRFAHGLGDGEVAYGR